MAKMGSTDKSVTEMFLEAAEYLEKNRMNVDVEDIKKKLTEKMCEKLGCIFKNHTDAVFEFENGKKAVVTRDYIGNSNHNYKLIFENDVLCDTTNPYTCGWALYVLGCEET